MRRLLGKISGFLSNRTMVGVDKTGNKYFTRNEEVDGIVKEKRWVIFKGEEDPTSIPVEWICWLNGQRKKAPTPEEMMELEARRERVRQNVARKVSGPDLKSFIQQLPVSSEVFDIFSTQGKEVEEPPSAMGGLRNPQESLAEKEKDESE
ncbi:hypothetical protein JHK84_049695 [Glycine max]|nr:hypothetical protein JHK84_049695 [Glycine max]